MRRPIPPLRSRRTRILLLLASYPDAVEGVTGDGARGDHPASRLLGRNLDLWYAGSYAQLEDCLDELKRIAPHFHFATWHHFVRLTLDGARRKEMAECGLRYLMVAMPENVYVPADISEANGYLSSEAVAYQRPRRMAA